MMRERNESGEDMLRSVPSVVESVLKRFDRSTRVTFLCTKRWRGTSSFCDESRFDRLRAERSGVGEPSLYAMFFPECRSVCLLRGGVTMMLASTLAEPIDDVELRLLFSSRSFTSGATGATFASLGQPIDCAKFSMEGVTGLFVLASTRSRSPDVRRGRGLGDGDAFSTISTGGSRSFFGDDLGVRLLRIVTLRIRSVFHSRSGTFSSTGGSLSSSAPTVVSALYAYGYDGRSLSVGVISSSSSSNASPSPRSSSTVLNLWSTGVMDLLRLGSDDASSRAVLKDSALDVEVGYVNRWGRSGTVFALEVRGGLGSGVGGLRALTGVLSDDFFDISELTTLPVCGEVSRA
jgi:hypothetical protein